MGDPVRNLHGLGCFRVLERAIRDVVKSEKRNLDRLAVTGMLLIDLMLPELVVEGASAYPEKLRGTGAVIPCGADCPDYHLTLDLFQRCAHIKRNFTPRRTIRAETPG